MRNSTVPLLVDTKHMQMTDMQFPWFAAQTRLVSSMAAGVPGTGTPLPGGLSDGFAFRGPSFGADDGMNSDDFILGWVLQSIWGIRRHPLGRDRAAVDGTRIGEAEAEAGVAAEVAEVAEVDGGVEAVGITRDEGVLVEVAIDLVDISLSGLSASKLIDFSVPYSQARPYNATIIKPV